MSMHRHVYADAQHTAEACARHILSILETALDGDGQVSLALSGGSTPAHMFRAMAAARFDWERVHLFWVDERGVPPTDSQSNFKMAEELLINPGHVPHRNVHRVHAEMRADMAAQRYADEIRSFFRLAPGELPSFDVMHRGMGADAHTASLFPGEPLIEDRENIAAAVYVEKMKQHRITLLPGVILNVKHTAMLVCGDDKAEPLKTVLTGPYDPMKYPAQVGAHHGRQVNWFLDEAAARLLD